MKITKEAFKNIVRETMIEENEYQQFFKKALEKTGKSIPDMSDEEKKAFFNKIDAAWQGKGEKNEELVGNQTKLDVDGDGEIEASDLAALRAGKKVNEATLEKGTKLRYEKNTFVVDYVVDKKYIGRDGYPKYILKVVKSNYPNKIKVGSTEEYEDARLTGLIRNRVMTFVKNEVVNEATLETGTKLRYDKNSNVVDYVVDKKYIGRDGYPRYILKVVTSNTKNIKVGSTIEYDDARLTGLIRNRVMTFVKNESVDEAANLKTIAMLLQNKGIRDAVRKDHADKLRKIIEDGGVSTKGVSDSELIKVVKQLTSESVDEAMASGPWVGVENTPTGPKLVKTFKSGNEAYAWVMKSPGGHSIMTKKQWNVSESVNEASKPTIKVVTKLKNEQGIQIVVTKTTKGETMYGGFVVRGKLQKVIPVGANKTKGDVEKRALQIWDEFGKQLGESVNEAKFYAFFNNKKHEIEGKDLLDAKQKAITMLKVPKSKVGLLAIVNANEHDKGSFRYESVNEGKFEPNFAKKIEAILKRELGVNKLEVTGPRTGRVMNRQSYYFHIPNPTHWVVVQKSQYGGPYPDDYYVALTNSLGQEKEETVVDHITDENVVLKTVSALAKKYKKQLTDTRMKESVKEKK